MHPGQLAPAPLLAPGCNLRITPRSQAANYHLKGVTFFWCPLRDNEGAGLNNKVYIIMIITFITRKLGEIAPRPRPDCGSRGENWNETEEENVFVIVLPEAWVVAPGDCWTPRRASVRGGEERDEHRAVVQCSGRHSHCHGGRGLLYFITMTAAQINMTFAMTGGCVTRRELQRSVDI